MLSVQACAKSSYFTSAYRQIPSDIEFGWAFRSQLGLGNLKRVKEQNHDALFSLDQFSHQEKWIATVYRQEAGIQCQNNHWGHTNKHVLYSACIFTRTKRPSEFYTNSSCWHPTRYAELLLESVLPSLATSVAAFLWPGQVTLHKDQTWAKVRNPTPSPQSSTPGVSDQRHSLILWHCSNVLGGGGGF